MSYVQIDPVTLMPSCSACWRPIPKTIAELVTVMSKWPVVCPGCYSPSREIRYFGDRATTAKAS